MAESSSPDLSELKSRLTSREFPISYDYLDPRSSHLLKITLSDYLPQRGDGSTHSYYTTSLPSFEDGYALPPAHHLTYFLPSMPDSVLLPDGTDPEQSPGKPFVRRMWAGGEVQFTNGGESLLRLDGSRIACVEHINDLAVKGHEGDEKIFVTMERLIGHCKEGEAEESIRRRFREPGAGALGVREIRNVVFMKLSPKSAEKKGPKLLSRM